VFWGQNTNLETQTTHNSCISVPVRNAIVSAHMLFFMLTDILL